MRAKPNRRYETASLNTEKMFAEALKALMKQMPLEKISVQRLADECGVNRKTFYYHFESIEELLRWTMERDAIEAFRDVERCNDPEELLQFIIEYSDKHRRMLRSVFRDTDIGLKRLQLYGGFHRVVRLSIEQAERAGEFATPPAYREYVTDFFVGALAHSFYQYIYERTPGTQEEMVEYCMRMVQSAVPAALKAGTKDKKVIP